MTACGGVTRCRWPAIVEAGNAPLTAAAFRDIIARAPETCPGSDCSPGGCRAQVRDALAGVWTTRSTMAGTKWQKSETRKKR